MIQALPEIVKKERGGLMVVYRVPCHHHPKMARMIYIDKEKRGTTI
jgi:hypothetical protein